jgi:hypothetical protein
MIVLDANILIRAVLGRRVRQLLEGYAARGIRFYAPDVAYSDAEKYLPPLLIKRGKFAADVSTALHYLQTLVESVDAESYERQSYLTASPRRYSAVNSSSFVFKPSSILRSTAASVSVS